MQEVVGSSPIISIENLRAAFSLKAAFLWSNLNSKFYCGKDSKGAVGLPLDRTSVRVREMAEGACFFHFLFLDFHHQFCYLARLDFTQNWLEDYHYREAKAGTPKRSHDKAVLTTFCVAKRATLLLILIVAKVPSGL